MGPSCHDSYACHVLLNNSRYACFAAQDLYTVRGGSSMSSLVTRIWSRSTQSRISLHAETCRVVMECLSKQKKSFACTRLESRAKKLPAREACLTYKCPVAPAGRARVQPDADEPRQTDSCKLQLSNLPYVILGILAAFKVSSQIKVYWAVWRK